MIKDKESTLKITTDEIEKKFGKGAIMRLGESTALNVEAIPTGALPLDVALGIGGVPRGRIVEIYGPESSGKTTVALHIIAEAQAAEASSPSSMLNMRSILSMQHVSVSMSMSCSSRSLIPVSKHSRSATCSFAAARSIAWSSTRSQLWCHAPRSKAKWAMLRSACKPAS